MTLRTERTDTQKKRYATSVRDNLVTIGLVLIANGSILRQEGSSEQDEVEEVGEVEIVLVVL